MLRPLGNSGFSISAVSLGCWPIARQVVGVSEADKLRTIGACFDVGINHLDTAHVYGPNGESETLIAKAIASRRDEFVIATKCGIHYAGKDMVNDAAPETLLRECDVSLRRLNTDHVELMYLHGPDPAVPLADSAGALFEMQKSGKARAIGACNLSLEQLEEFQAVCPLTAVQLPYNMLQRDIEARIVPWCVERNVAITVYWVLMKGLLTGSLPRDYQFATDDSRRNYPMFQGEEWNKNQDFVERLRKIATTNGVSVPQLVVAWTIRKSGITAALCGATRPEQIKGTAAVMQLDLPAQVFADVDTAIAERGPAKGKRMIR